MNKQRKILLAVAGALILGGGSLLIWTNFGQAGQPALSPALQMQDVRFAQELHAYDLQLIGLGNLANVVSPTPEVDEWNLAVKHQDKLVITFLRKNNGIKVAGLSYPSTYTIQGGQFRQAILSKNKQQITSALNQLALIPGTFDTSKASERNSLGEIAAELKSAAKRYLTYQTN